MNKQRREYVPADESHHLGRETRWTDPASPWMANHINVEVENHGIGSGWSRTKRRAA